MPDITVEKKFEVGFEHPWRRGFVKSPDAGFERGQVIVNSSAQQFLADNRRWRIWIFHKVFGFRTPKFGGV